MLRKNAKIELLKRIPLFAACSKRELAEISALADEVDLPAGAVLINEGEFGRQFFVVIEGTVEVRKNGRKLPTRGGTDVFGEISLLTNSRTTATVTATSPLQALVITPTSFSSLLRRSPSIQLKLLAALAERLAPDTI